MTKKSFQLLLAACTILICLLAPTLSARAQYVAHSVLATGNWWKMEIREEGIYRIKGSDVSELTGTPVDRLALYGQQGGLLPVRNGDPRFDDLQEVAIQIHDANNDGYFDADDYILYFATGPDKWYYDSDIQTYRWSHHPYTNANFLYLTSKEGSHKRIATSTLQSTGDELTTCHALVVHNRDLTNCYSSGQIWVGERFNSANSQGNVTLTLPATATGDLKVRYALASISNSNSSFTVKINGQSRTHPISAKSPYATFSELFPAGSSATVNIALTYQYGENLAAGYLDYVEIDALVPMTLSGSFTLMYLPPADSSIHPHRVNGVGDGCQVWDVTDYNEVTALATQRTGNTLLFNNKNDISRTYAVFNPGAYRTPEAITPIANQDLHGTPVPDMVIICHSSLQTEAQRLANIHSIYDNMQVLTLTQEEVFNEFSSGQTDPVAVREMLRMFRQRAAADSNNAPQHLLLFGKGTYDNRHLLGDELPTVVTYQTPQSFDDDGGSMGTDDFFTFLENGESGTVYESRDISVGRLPAKNSDEANHLVTKIEHYITRSDLLDDNSRGDWRNCVALLADDADPSCAGDTVFTNSSEITARQIQSLYPHYTIDKIYADAYIQQSGADGSFYPDVNNALKKRMDYGCLLLNYIGHGSAQYIGTERYMMKSNISNYANIDRLAFFVTSTCTFGRFDMTDETCGAEDFVLASGAGIGCLAASRPISHIQQVNTEIIMQSLNPSNTIGEAVRIAKNKRTATLALTLLGDPAIRLSFPIYDVVVTAINGRPVTADGCDSAQVLSTVEVTGEIRDKSGQLVSDFDGTLFPVVYDRPVTTHTLANDNDGCEVVFTQQNNLLYKGRTTVQGGRFTYRFIVPRDVAYKFEPVRMSHYAKSATEDACGAYTRLYVGGFDESVQITESRPDIRLFMNDTNFLNGGITDQNPTLLAILFDSIGINAVGSGIGHDITATLDNSPNSIITLNEFYEPDINDEHFGTIRYNLNGLAAGTHTITLKAWNIFNYSNSATVTFRVRNSEQAATQFHTYPNPASDYATLQMEHNCKSTVSQARLEIYDMRGCCVYTCSPAVSNDSYVVGPVRWDLRSNAGTRVNQGVYIARFIVTTSDGEKLVEQGKIIVK